MSADVPAPLLRSVLLSMELLGHDASAVLRRSARARSSWEELLTALESFEAGLGPAQMQRLMETLATRSSAVSLATELLGEPRETYVVLLEAASRQGLVTVSSRPSGAGLTVRLELKPGLRPSLTFFRACGWFLAAVPRARGLGDARVVNERLSERELLCVVTPPSVRGALALDHSSPAHLGTVACDLFGCSEPAPAGRQPVPSSQAIQARFGLTRAEARVVRRLAEGGSIKRLAVELGVSPETVRTHAKRAMNKTDTHRQAELVSLVLQGER